MASNVEEKKSLPNEDEKEPANSVPDATDVARLTEQSQDSEDTGIVLSDHADVTSISLPLVEYVGRNEATTGDSPNQTGVVQQIFNSALSTNTSVNFTVDLSHSTGPVQFGQTCVVARVEDTTSTDSDEEQTQRKPKSKKRINRGNLDIPETSTGREKSAIEKQTLETIFLHREDETFVSTNAVQKGKQILEEHGVLIYTGLAGDGKTKNGIELLNQYQRSHPEWVFFIFNDINKWSDVHPDGNTVILFDDCLGKTNANMELINDWGKYWSKIYACVTSRKVKVIFTIRKHIVFQNKLKFRQYANEMFSKAHVVDLTSEEYNLSGIEKTEILQRHCKKKQIIIETEDKRIEKVLDDSVKTRLDFWTYRRIICSNPVIGYPLSCYLFSNIEPYTNQGIKFFENPSDILVQQIKEMISTDSKYSDKLQYCIMCYMMLKEDSIDLNKMDEGLLRHVVESVNLKLPTPRQIKEAAENLNQRYIVEEKKKYHFLHQTVLESVALCFYDENVELLLQNCSNEFLSEFIKPENYETSEGEVVLVLNQDDYKHLVQRFIQSLLNASDKLYITGYKWCIAHPMMDDEHFVDCFMDVVNSNTAYKTALQDKIPGKEGLLYNAGCYGKTYFLDSLFKTFTTNSTDYLNDLLWKAAMSGYTDTVVWLLDHQIGLAFVGRALSVTNVVTMTSMIKHAVVTLGDIKGEWNRIYFKFDSNTVAALLNRWPNIEQKHVSDMLCGVCLFDNYKTIEDVIIKHRPEVITQRNMTRAFRWACCNEKKDVVKYLLGLNHPRVHCKQLYATLNDENLTTVHIAANFGSKEVLTELIDLGMSATERTKSGLSVLQLAIIGYIANNVINIYSAVDMVFIESVNSVISTYLECNVTTLHKRLGNRNQSFLQIFSKLLNQNGVELTDLEMKVNDHNFTMAHFGVIFNDMELIKLLNKARKESLFTKSNEDVTCLHAAAFFGKYGMLVKLSEIGLCVTNRTNANVNVLQMAILGRIATWPYNSNVADIINGMVGSLVQYYDKFKLRNYHDRNNKPDSIAVIRNLLLDQKCDKDDLNMVLDDFGGTVAHYCVLHDDVELLTLLYEQNKKSILTPNNDKMTCAHIAAFFGWHAILARLVKMGLSITDKTNSDVSVLQMAILGYTLHNHNVDKVSGITKHMIGSLVHYHCTRFNLTSNYQSDYKNVLCYLLNHKECVKDELNMVVDGFGGTLVHYCAVFNDMETLTILHNQSHTLIFKQNDDKMTLAHIAAFFGSYDVLVNLSEMGLSVTDITVSNVSVLQMAIVGYMVTHHGYMADSTIQTIKSLVYYMKRFRHISFIHYCNKNVFRYLLEQTECLKRDLDLVIDAFGSTLAHYCAMINDVELLSVLLEQRREIILKQNNDKMTCAHIAAFFGKYDILVKILDMGLFGIEKTKSNVLQMVILGYIVECQYPMEMSNITKKRIGSLQYYMKHHKDLHLGLRFEFDVKAPSRTKKLAGPLLTYWNHIRCYIDSHHGETNEKSEYTRIFSYLLHHKVCINDDLDMIVDDFGGTLAHYSVLFNDKELLTLLHEQSNAIISTTNKDEMTCAHIAAFFGRNDMLVKLVEMGLSITDRTKSDLSVLQSAIIGYIVCENSKTESTDTNYFRTDITDYKNKKERYFSLKFQTDYTRVVCYLLSQTETDKGDLEMLIDETDATLVHYCIMFSNANLLDILHKQNLTQAYDKTTYAHIAAFLGRYDMLIKVVEMGLSVTDRTTTNVSVLQMAILGYIVMQEGLCNTTKSMIGSFVHYKHLLSKSKADYISVLSYLLYREECDKDDLAMPVDDSGGTMAHYCIKFNDVQLLALVHERGTKPIYQHNNDKTTYAHIAAFLGRYDMLIKLVEMGLSVTDRTKTNVSVLQMAILGYIVMHEGLCNTTKSMIGSLVHYKHLLSKSKADYISVLSYLLYHEECDKDDLAMTVDDSGGTMAHYCIKFNDVQLLALVHEISHQPTHQHYTDKMTYAHIAAFFGKYDALIKIVEMGLSVTDRTRSNVSVLQMAILGYIKARDNCSRLSCTTERMIGSLAHNHYCYSSSQTDHVIVFNYLLNHTKCVKDDLCMVVDDCGSTLAHYCGMFNDVQLLVLLQQRSRESICTQNNDKMTTAHIAAFFGQYDVLVKLVKMGISILDRTISNVSVLQMAILGYIVRCQKGKTLSNFTREMVGSLVHYVRNFGFKVRSILWDFGFKIQSEYLRLFQYLLHQDQIDKGDLDMTIDDFGGTLVHYCVIFNDVKLLTFLYNQNSELIFTKNNVKMNEHKITYAHIAAFFGQYNVLVKLVEIGTSVTHRTKSNASVLHMAILGYVVIRNNFKTFADSKKKVTGSLVKCLEEIGLYIECHFELNDERNRSIYDIFSSKISIADYKSVFTYLLQQTECNKDDLNMVLDDFGHKLVHYCVMFDDVELLACVCERSRELILAQNKDQLTCSHLAAFFGNYELLAISLSVEDKNESNVSVLQMTILGYITKCQKNRKLLDVTKKMKGSLVLYEECPAYFTTRKNYTRVFSYVLQHNDCVKDELNMVVDEFGGTLAHYCVMFNDVKLLALLHEHNRQSIFKKNNDKMTCAHLAAFFGKFDLLVKLLVEIGLSILDRTKSGANMLQMSILGYIVRCQLSPKVSDLTKTLIGSLEYYTFQLICSHADSDYASVLKYLLLHKECIYNDLDMVVDECGGTLVHYCVLYNDVHLLTLVHKQIYEFLFKQTDEKMTCVQIAAFFGRYDMLIELIEMGLSVTDRTELNVSVLQMAILGYVTRRVGVGNMSNDSKAMIGSRLHYWNHILLNDERYIKSDYTGIFRHLLLHKDCVKDDLDTVLNDFGGTLAHYCVVFNDVKSLAILYEKDCESIFTKNNDKMTYAHIAAFFGRYNMLIKLIQMGSSVTDRTELNVSVLQMAILGYVIRRVGVGNMSNVTKAMIGSLVHYRNHIEPIKLNFKLNYGNYIESDYTGIFRHLLLHQKCVKDELETVVDDFGGTLAHYCIVFNDANLLTLLYEKRPESVFKQNKYKITCAHLIAFLGKYEFLEIGLSVTDTTDSNVSELRWAILGYKVKYEHFKCSDVANEMIGSLEHYLNCSRQYYDDHSDYKRVFCYLLKHTDCNKDDLDMTVYDNECTLAHYCAIHNDVELLTLLHKQSSKSILTQNKDKMTCAHIAAFFGRYDLLVEVLQMGLSIADKTKSNLSVLQMAILGYIARCQVYNLSDVTKEMIGPLVHYMKHIERVFTLQFQSDYIRVFSYLLHHKDCVKDDLDTVVDDFGGTLVHYCAVRNDTKLLTLIHEQNSESILKQNNDKMTCTHIAVFFGEMKYNMFIKLTELGLSITARTRSNISVLQMAMFGYRAMCGDKIMAAYKGVKRDLEKHSLHGTTLDKNDAVKKEGNQLDVIKTDRDSKMCVHESNLDMTSIEVDKIQCVISDRLRTHIFYTDRPLSVLISKKNYTNLLRFLIHQQESVKEDLLVRIDSHNCTLAHYCVLYNSPEIIDLLRDSYPSVLYIQNRNNHKPIHLAALLGRSKIFDILFDIDTDIDKSGLQTLVSEGKQIRTNSNDNVEEEIHDDDNNAYEADHTNGDNTDGDKNRLWKMHFGFIPYKLFDIIKATTSAEDYQRIELKLLESH